MRGLPAGMGSVVDAFSYGVDTILDFFVIYVILRFCTGKHQRSNPTTVQFSWMTLIIAVVVLSILDTIMINLALHGPDLAFDFLQVHGELIMLYLNNLAFLWIYSVLPLKPEEIEEGGNGGL
jgi:Na+/proline symporter